MSVKKFGPFVLDQMIGRGGMGAVYRARDEKTDQVVAVKALLLPLERERERFEAEISTLRLLRHENIVKLYGFGQEDGILYYAMEYVDGPSLATLLRRGRRFSWEETVYIGARICNALKHAHDRGVIHRDIKPANILLVNGGVVKVSDYGIAQYFGASRLTNANQVVGTIEFMAPEQAQAGAVGPKTDVYSLGALMYALLTGRPPYVAKTLPELLQKFREGLPDPIRAERPETPKAVEDVVLDLLQIQPEKRPGDARLIGRRLEALLYSSKTCPGGNPFADSQFTAGAPTGASLMDKRGASTTSSRVDLENDSTTMHREGVEDFRPDEEPVGVAKDFPYRPIDGDDAGVGFDLESPFDKTTERAASSEIRRGTAPNWQRDDFFVGDGKDPEGRGLSDSETSTCLATPSGAKSPDAASSSSNDSSATTSGDASGAPSDREQYVIQPTVVGDSASCKTGGSAVSTEFDVSFESSAVGDATEQGSAAGAETAASDVSHAPASSSSETNAASASGVRSNSGVGAKIGRAAKLLSAAATTIVDKASGSLGTSKKVKIVEPIAPSGGLATPRNVPFDQLDDVVDNLGATPLDKFRKSTFTPVAEDELGELPDSDDDRPTSIFVKFRVFWVAFVFLAFAALGATAFRAPSADRLYSKIDRAFSRSTAKRFDATLRRSERDMKRFVDLYPNDPRAEKINFFLCEIQIDELDQRLERQVANAGRDAPLQPIMRAYLDARRAAQVDWKDGSKKLAAFIELFGSEAILAEINAAESEVDASSKGEGNASSLRGLVVQNRWKLWKGESAPVVSLPDQLVVIAKRRLAALEAETKTTRRADLALLNDRLITAESLEQENPERADAIRRAAEVLYGDAEWARSAFANPGASDVEPADPTPEEPISGESNEALRSEENDSALQSDAQ